ncbi:relaxase/mobilization nuclease domain-containing protein [Flexithrix dorotheae]|uniref:relaxase/mobilization nuclease domain-containing protein n=1 Tax=Flexithrix dorotheae TaxID=70993 RepID=UPI00036043BA|nr:relaxase/mobilization nuclease domain-containing protein [Flexithrix dorotheae]
MIAKINNGESFKGVLQYVLDKEKEYEILDSNEVLNTDHIGLLSNQFIAQSTLNSRVKKPVWHAQIAFAKEDDSLINDEMITEIGQKYLKKMGISDNQYLIVKHADTAHTHIHIVINRVDNEGKPLKDNMMKRRSMEVAKGLEVEYNLTIARLKGRTFSIKNANTNYVYGFRPDKQILTLRLKGILSEAFSRKFTSFKSLDQFLLKHGIKIFQQQGRGGEFAAADYTYSYFDNQKDLKLESKSTIKLSRVGKGFSLEEILADLKANKAKEPHRIREMVKRLEKAFKQQKNSYDISNSNPAGLFAYLHFEGINLKFEFFRKAVDQANIPKGVKKVLLLLEEEKEKYSVGQSDLKKSIYSNQIEEIDFTPKMQFFFTKSEVEIIGKEKVSRFYKTYFERVGGELPIGVTNILINKRADQNTVNYVISQLTGKVLPYHKNAVKVDLATICFNLAQQKELKNDKAHKEVMTNRIVLNAYQNFKNYSDDPAKLMTYMAKRGIGFRRVGGNMHLIHEEQDLGLATAFNIKEFGKFAPNRETVFNDDRIAEIFKRNYEPEKANYYQLLDKRLVKNITIELKKGKAFQLDEFDISFMEKDFAESLNRQFAKATHRGRLV